MKLVYSTLDVLRAADELKALIIGSRVNNVYDVNNKTYLLKLARNEEKFVLLLESGSRVHITEYEWAKNVMPSGFSMKLRKHIRNRKISGIQQLGIDRIIDVTFGFEMNCFHLIVELYDRGNMFLTDHTYTILHLLRPRTDANLDVRYAAHEKYPVDLVRKLPLCLESITSDDSVRQIKEHVLSLLNDVSGPWDNNGTDRSTRSAQKVLSGEFCYGQVPIDHCCRLAEQSVREWRKQGLTDTTDEDQIQLVKGVFSEKFAKALRELLQPDDGSENGADIIPVRGYIFGKKHLPEDEELLSQDDFQPFLFEQYRAKSYIAFNSFSKAVDTYYSRIESQKTSESLAQNERKANKKFENIKKDHELRLSSLRTEQETDVRKAQLLEINRKLVDNIILMINHALSNQLDWRQLEAMVEEAKIRGDPAAGAIVQLNLQCSQLTLRLSDPIESAPSESEDDPAENSTLDIVIDLDINALNNARKYYDRKRAAVKKEDKTLTASNKALKSAAFKAAQTRKEVRTMVQISKVRKPLWFEKFYWFISSENYLIVAGRDSQQNEALVKRHLGPDDIYVHADLHGASSVVIKARPLTSAELTDRFGEAKEDDSARLVTTRPPLPPPKTLVEAGSMAITLSSAWNARVVTSAWWVRQDQVSKTAPSGEYLNTGAFMIRGRKNYLPPCHLIYGFGVLFKLDDESVEHHRGERRVTNLDHLQSSCPTDGMDNAALSGSEASDGSDAEDKEKGFPSAELHLDLLKTRDKTGITQQVEHTIAYSRGKKIKQIRKSTQKKEAAANAAANAVKDTDSNVAPQVDGAEQENQPGKLKRRQKAKVRKILQKYGDQDDDERLMCMQILQGEKAKLSKHHILTPLVETEQCEPTLVSEGPSDDEKTTEEVNVDEELKHDSPDVSEIKQEPDTATTQLNTVSSDAGEKPDVNDAAAEDDDDEDERRPAEDDWLRLMDTFTGQPQENDLLLYALPVCAPYSALLNYKYKVKLTPGTAKRGKAAKTAMNVFTTDKGAIAREKDLLRVMKGEDVSRNFPGCVKITLPQGNAVRRK